MGWHFWIDRGGTFTDLIGVSPNGEKIVKKILSNQPEQAGDPTIRAIKDVLRIKENDPIPDGLINEVRLGTTVATNTLLEEVGSPVLLFCNHGLEDLLRIGDQHRPDLFALKIERSKFIAQDVIGVSGRINAEGIEIEPLVIEKELEDRAHQQLRNGIKSCAIAFLHSYSNPVHELRLKTWLIKIGFNTVICSHQVSPHPRVVPRGQTALIEATVSPVLFGYLNQIMSDLGTSTKVKVMGSSGALLIPEDLLAKDTILSGPAGGMVGSVAAARESGLNSQPIIGFDMGGTSTDVFYASGNMDDEWERLPETEIAGQKLMAHRLPIHTVAAGGGSIISTSGSRLKVGPRSAGANPGPACYRHGGPLTITDANLLLGRIQSKEFPALFGPSKNQILDLAIVEKKFKEIAKTLRSTPEAVAEGALGIAIEQMADAIKQVSTFCGYDIRKATLVAYGGAGGQHACRLAQQLGLANVLIHPMASVLSAYGIGIARQTYFHTINLRKPLCYKLIKKLERICKEEQIKAKKKLNLNCDPLTNKNELLLKSIARVEIRYQSSEQGLIIKLETTNSSKNLTEKYEAAHLQRFNYIPPRNEPLIVERLEIEVIAPATTQISINGKGGAVIARNNHVHIHFQDCGWRKVICYQRNSLVPGLIIQGPALIVESNSSIVIEPNWTVKIDPNGSLIMKLVDSNKKKTNKSFSTKNKEIDPILLELYNHRFTRIAIKMGERLRQTSRSVNIRERLDFSCAIFDKHGALVANAPHIPVHLGAMGESIVDLLNEISIGHRKQLRESETVITNDPFNGGTHLPDITAITPIFSGGKTPIYFVACRGHHSDVGGLTPGSMPPFSKTIHDEGLLLRNETFIINGVFNEVKWKKRLHKDRMPPRNPSELLADLKAQVAANQLGVIEIKKLISHFGIEEVNSYMEFLQKNAVKSLEKTILNIKDQKFSVLLDHGAKICVDIKVNKKMKQVKLDFTGTSPQSHQNFQAPLSITKAAVLYVFRCLIMEEIPLNSGCFKPIKIIIPKGCLLNPTTPAAVVAGNVETSQALCNLLFGALGVQAASQGTMNNLTFGDDNKQYYETIAGGSGAGNGFNGTNGIQTHMTNSRLTDPEIIEQRYAVKLEQFLIRKGSGGKGRWNGGDGLIRKFRFSTPMTVSIISGSRLIPPFGLKGGMPGKVGLNQLELVNGTVQDLEGCTSFQVSSGEAIIIESPGGGGYGVKTI